MALAIEDETLPGAFKQDVIPLGNLNATLHGSLVAMPMRSFLDPKDPAILEDLKRIACATAGLFCANETPAGEDTSFPAPNKETRQVVSEGPKPWAVNTVKWAYGFYAALAARERAATDLLTQNWAETLRKGETKSPEWFYLSFAALQSFVQKRDDTEPKLLAAMKATDPDKVEPTYKNWVLDIEWPILELAWQAFARDTPAFDEAMWKALEGHKHYYTKAEGKKDMLGLIALGPLAMAVWAKDLGVYTTVESDYIPRWIIDR